MAVALRQLLVARNKYSIKCPYQMVATSITVHNTANDAPAENEVKYMIGNDNKVSFHIAVDDKEAVQGIPLDRNAWHAGDGNGAGNRGSIAIEICYSKSGGERFTKAEKNAAELIASMLKERGWGIDKVKKHQDWSGKYCPHRTLDLGWERFLNLIRSYMGQSTVPTPQPSKPTQKPTTPTAKDYLQKGDKGSAVKEMQKMLIVCGYSCGKYGADSVFGNDAEKAVKEFQRDNGLSVDGVYGKNTKAKLIAKYDKVKLDGIWGCGVTVSLQTIFKTVIDGEISRQPHSNKKYLVACHVSTWNFTDNYNGGSAVLKQLQIKIGTGSDGLFGKNSVIALQNWLNRNGYACGKADGYLGAKTVVALQKWIIATL